MPVYTPENVRGEKCVVECEENERETKLKKGIKINLKGKRIFLSFSSRRNFFLSSSLTRARFEVNLLCVPSYLDTNLPARLGYLLARCDVESVASL